MYMYIYIYIYNLSEMSDSNKMLNNKVIHKKPTIKSAKVLPIFKY